MNIKEGDYFYLKSYEELDDADKNIFTKEWYKPYFGIKLKVLWVENYESDNKIIVGCHENGFSYREDWIKKATKQIELDFGD